MIVALSASFRDKPTVRHVLKQCDRIYTTQDVNLVSTNLETTDNVFPLPDGGVDLVAFLEKRHEHDLVFTHSDLQMLSKPFRMDVMAPKRILESICANFAAVVEKVNSLSSVCDELVEWCEQGTALCRSVAAPNTMALLDRFCQQLRSRITPQPAAPALTPLTTKQVTQWLRLVGLHCPYCQFTDLAAGPIRGYIPKSLTQDMHCANCGRDYIECFSLTGLIELGPEGDVIARH